MIHIENIFICIAAPLIIGLFLLKDETRTLIAFLLSGIIACFLSTYLNSFIASIYGFTSVEAIIKVTPMIEEFMKALPLIFYMIIFTPTSKNIYQYSIVSGIGFATFENICFIVGNDISDIYFVLIRGFAVGIMHVLCAVLLGFSLGRIIEAHKAFYWSGIYISVGVCITYHAIYNLMVCTGGYWQICGYCMPITTLLLLFTKIRVKSVSR